MTIGSPACDRSNSEYVTSVFDGVVSAGMVQPGEPGPVGPVFTKPVAGTALLAGSSAS